tara:strand:+ start:531 stop:698 length:168 start_codon:yes stop_codon:yes gene_type:complete
MDMLLVEPHRYFAANIGQTKACLHSKPTEPSNSQQKKGRELNEPTPGLIFLALLS